jgi:two-component system cell cycle response regulator
VDDDVAILESVSWVLQDHGFVVDTLPGAATLLAEIAHGTRPLPDVLLLDVLMPDGNGVALLERLKADARWREVPVLMLSAVPLDEPLVRALGLGAVDFVRKPFRARELAARVEAQVRLGAELRQARTALHRAQAELVRARADADSSRQLVDILHEVTGDLAADEIYHLLARRVARALAVRSCAVVLAGPAPGEGMVVAAFEHPALRQRPIALDRVPEAREALASGMPVFVEDVATHPLYAGHRGAGTIEPGDPAPRSAIAVPFQLDAYQRGVLLLRRTGDQPTLALEDVALAEAAVGAAVAVIQRAKIVEVTLADNARLEMLATTDPLTHLLNRRALVERLTAEMERALRYDGTVAILLLDLDHFKRINDTHGHLIGDAALRELAALLTAAVRSSDVVGRFGGEEFLVVLPETDAAGALSFAERTRERIEAHTFHPWDDERTLALTASVGVAAFPSGRIESVEDLFARADAAMYRAKAQGRNRVEG